MLNYFFAIVSFLTVGNGQAISEASQLYPTQKVILEKEAPQLTDPRDFLDISAVSVPEDEFTKSLSKTGDQMCPVVRKSMVPSKTGIQIKPIYYVYQKEDIVEVDVFANDGLVFTEFFLQVKDSKTNKTCGFWKVLDDSQESYRCGERDLTQLLDTVRWRTPGETSKVRLQWVASFPGLPKVPEEVVIIGTFRTATENYQHTISSKLFLRDKVSLKECCEHEISDDCSQMCTAANMVDSLSMATESCKMQIHKVQKCYLTGKTKDEKNPTENEIITKTDFMRKDCCAKESIDQKCLPFCGDQSVAEWPLLVGECQHTLRQVTNCWTSTSCVNRCNGQWRGDYSCQCDTDCTRRGDCCPDRDMACRQSLPIELEYWKSNKIDCGYLPNFEKLPEADVEKRVSEATFEESEEEPRIFGIETDKAFVMRMTSYFFVRAKGTYKIFMMLGQRDTARVKIDNIEIFKSGCSWSELLDATIYLAGGGHQIVIEFTDTGYADQLKIAYSGPDTLRKPTQIPYERRDDILYMGPPPVVATPASTMNIPKTATTKSTTTTTTHELLSRPEIEHEIKSQNAVRPRYYPTERPETRATPFVFNPMHFPNHYQNDQSEKQPEPEKRDDLIITVVIINLVFLFIILACGFLAFLRWRSQKSSSTRPYNSKPTARTTSTQVKQGSGESAIGRRMSGDNPISYNEFIAQNSNFPKI